MEVWIAAPAQLMYACAHCCTVDMLVIILAAITSHLRVAKVSMKLLHNGQILILII